MNVTDKEVKCSQPLKEGSPQKDSSESERYVGAHNSLRITDNNITNANKSRARLLEYWKEIILTMHLRESKANKGARGVDKMEVDECTIS